MAKTIEHENMEAIIQSLIGLGIANLWHTDLKWDDSTEKARKASKVSKGWEKGAAISVKKAIKMAKDGHGIIAALKYPYLIIDVDDHDPKKKACAENTPWLKEFMEHNEPFATTGQGGKHYLVKYDSRMPLAKGDWGEFKGNYRHDRDKSVESWTNNIPCAYILIAPTPGYSFNKAFDISKVPDVTILLTRNCEYRKATKAASPPVKASKADTPADVKKKGYYDKELKPKIVDALSKLDPSMGYDSWLKVGMALHDWNAGNPGWNLWEKWSKKGNNYEAGATELKWKGFCNQWNTEKGYADQVVKIATLFYMVKEAELERLIERIKKSTIPELKLDIIPHIEKQGWNDDQREKLAQTIQDHVESSTGKKVSIEKIRNMIAIKVNDSEVPGWCKKYAFVNSQGQYFNIEKGKWVKIATFNHLHGNEVARSKRGNKITASKMVADNSLITVVDQPVYLPMEPKIISKVDGMIVVNTFNKKSLPFTPDEYGDGDLEALELVKGHIRLVCGNDIDAATFEQWFYHQGQNMGELLSWAPVFVGGQGVGKSVFGEIVRAILGDRNVGTVSTAQVGSNFNGWATGRLVNDIQELRIAGHNSHEVANAIKPLITDRTIQIETKGVDQYSTINTTNYLCYTNHPNCIPMEDDDRRFWVINSAIERRTDIDDMVGIPYVEYYGRLFDAIRGHKPAIRKWAMDGEITDEFSRLSEAPMTRGKEQMILRAKEGIKGLIEAQDLINNPNPGSLYDKEIVSTQDLFRDIIRELAKDMDGNITLTQSDKTKILNELRLPYTKKVKVNGKTRQIRTAKFMSHSDIKSHLSLIHI